MRLTETLLNNIKYQSIILVLSLAMLFACYSQSSGAPMNIGNNKNIQAGHSNLVNVEQRIFSTTRQRRVHRPRGSYSKGDDVHYPRGSRGRPNRPDRPHRPRRPKVKFNFVVPLIDLAEEERERARPKKPRKPRVKKRPRRRVRLPAALPIADKRYRKKQVVIVIKQSRSSALHRSIARKYGLRLIRGRYYSILKARVQVYRIPDRRSVGVVLAQLKRERRVSASQPNYIYSLTSDNEKGQSEELQYSHGSMKIRQAHKHALGRKIKIAVIDTGLDRTHPEFNKALITQYNAVEPKRKYKGHKHGTAIAGIMAAQNDVKGVAPSAHILDARAFFVSKKTGSPETDSMILVEALQWSYDKGAKIFNLSFEGPKDPVIEDAIQAIYEKGRIFVGAAGNGGPKAKPAYPAAYKYVIATTAIDKKNNRYKMANRGPYVSVAAPGVRVMVLSTANSYSFQSGTSIASAHISGLVALMLERKPRLSGREISRILKKTAQDLGDPGPDSDYGAGLADAYSSVQAVQEISLSKK
ncbi:MAG: S8 family peptidase [Methyloligellaceae bacterium]